LKSHDKNIDNLFKSKLQNQKFEVKEEYIIDLDNKLNEFFPEKKKKRGILFYSSLILLFTFVSLTTLYFYNRNSNKTLLSSHSSKTDLKKKSHTQSTDLIDKNNQTKTNNNKANHSKIDESLKTNSTETKTIKSSIQTKTKHTSTNVINSDDSKIKEQDKNNPTNTSSVIIHKNQDVSNNLKPEIEGDNLDKNLSDDNKQLDIDNEDDNSLDLTTKKDVVDETKQQSAEKNDLTNPVDNNSNPLKDSTVNNDVASNDNIQNQETDVDSLKNQENNSSNNPEDKNTDLTQPKKHKKVGIMLGLDYGFNFNKPFYSGVESDIYSKNHTEKITNTAQFNTNFILRNHFLVGAGIGQNQFLYDYNYSINETIINSDTTQTTTFDSTYVLDNYIYQQNVIVDSVYHYNIDSTTTISITNDTTITKKPFSGATKANYIFIPLNIGYMYSFKRFIFEGQINLRYHLLQKTMGGYYNNNTFTLFETATNPIFRKSYFDVSFKLGVNYRVWKQLYLSSALRFTPQQTSIYKAVETEKRIQVTQLSFGLSYKF